ncbi:GTPase domain-containing protein [Caproiciproducens sp. R1]|uniref:GTPase domain-containing protein n=1 Tax=Caproiciproducens sp. R1 TaxID=3435000 RepID=UPI004033936A
MENSPYYEEMLSGKNKVKAFMLRQESVETTTLMGPTSSAKSTITTELLPPVSNMLLSKNVGDTAQTTLIPTLLMLNSRFCENEVLIQCIPRNKSAYPDLLENLKTVITDSLYEVRDELYDFSINEVIIKKILNPVNRSYHAYQFAKEQELTQRLTELLNDACQTIIEMPEPLLKAAESLYKQLRLKDQTAKKKEAYEHLVDERLSNDKDFLDNLLSWYKILINMILADLQPLWTYETEYTLLDDISDSSPATQLMEKLYGSSSACSLVFEEVRYATSPSKDFKKAYLDRNAAYPGRTVKINILDTVGLTQSSQDREIISDNIDKILNRKSNALLFLCASDEQPSVYETCISLLLEKNKKLENKPVTICRTKADIVIRNKMINNWRKDTGRNAIPLDSPEYERYVTEAFDSFLDEYINNPSLGEEQIGKEVGGHKIEYLSLAPDLSATMDKHLNGELSPTRIFDILLNIAEQVDIIYAGGYSRPWLQSKDLIHYPLNVICTAQPLSKTIALALTAKDSQNGNQYKQYIKSADAIYHGRSVNCFRNKLSYGEGHETRAFVYADFRLYITNMVARWLREVIPVNDLINNLSISFDYLYNSGLTDEVKSQFPSRFKDLLQDNWWNIIERMAKKLSYDCLSKEFEEAFYFCSWSDGFRESLKVIQQKFSSVEYWQKNIIDLLKSEANDLLQKMYIFD